MAVTGLSQLVDLSIGTPEIGTVNFTALHRLLHAIVKRLDISSDLKETLNEVFPAQSPIVKVSSDKSATDSQGFLVQDEGSYAMLQVKVSKMEKDLALLNSIPSAQAILAKVKSDQPITELYQLVSLSKKIDANEEATKGAMNMLDVMMSELKALNDNYDKLSAKVSRTDEPLWEQQQAEIKDLHHKMLELSKSLNGIYNMNEELNSIKDKLKNISESADKSSLLAAFSPTSLHPTYDTDDKPLRPGSPVFASSTARSRMDTHKAGEVPTIQQPAFNNTSPPPPMSHPPAYSFKELTAKLLTIQAHLDSLPGAEAMVTWSSLADALTGLKKNPNVASRPADDRDGPADFILAHLEEIGSLPSKLDEISKKTLALDTNTPDIKSSLNELQAKMATIEAMKAKLEDLEILVCDLPETVDTLTPKLGDKTKLSKSSLPHEPTSSPSAQNVAKQDFYKPSTKSNMYFMPTTYSAHDLTNDSKKSMKRDSGHPNIHPRSPRKSAQPGKPAENSSKSAPSSKNETQSKHPGSTESPQHTQEEQGTMSMNSSFSISSGSKTKDNDMTQDSDAFPARTSLTDREFYHSALKAQAVLEIKKENFDSFLQKADRSPTKFEMAVKKIITYQSFKPSKDKSKDVEERRQPSTELYGRRYDKSMSPTKKDLNKHLDQEGEKYAIKSSATKDYKGQNSVRPESPKNDSLANAEHLGEQIGADVTMMSNSLSSIAQEMSSTQETPYNGRSSPGKNLTFDGSEDFKKEDSQIASVKLANRKERAAFSQERVATHTTTDSNRSQGSVPFTIDGRRFSKTIRQIIQDDYMIEISKLQERVGWLEDSYRSHGKELQSAKGESNTMNKYLKLSKKMDNLASEMDSKMQDVDVELRSIMEASLADGELVMRAEMAIGDLYSQLESMKRLNDQLLLDDLEKSRILEDLANQTEMLKVNKVDIEQFSGEIEQKATKMENSTKTDRAEFQNVTAELQKLIDDLLSKLLILEDVYKRAHQKLESEIGGKVDAAEVERIKAYIDKRMKELNSKIKKQHSLLEGATDEAAGLKRRMPFNCLSCDRPVHISQFGHLPAGDCDLAKTGQQYTPAEIEQIRQQVKRDLTEGDEPTEDGMSKLKAYLVHFGKDLGEKIFITKSKTRMVSPDLQDLYQKSRRCGGKHTVTQNKTQGQSITKGKGLLLKDILNDKDFVAVGNLKQDEVAVTGNDGHYYKGRYQVLQVDRDYTEALQITRDPVMPFVEEFKQKRGKPANKKFV